jgi:class 3 adenylate cyclase
LTVDASLDDGWGATFPVKGIEVEGTILFSDISGFSARTKGLSSTETLIYVNNFFTWISAEALRGSFGIVDKYIGDEIMIVFSKDFGSKDPFVEALQAARWMGENDFLDYSPHIGIASGIVTVGYVGTALKYNCSVFGFPVALAARCAGVKPQIQKGQFCSSTIVFPAEEWKERDFNVVFTPRKYESPDGSIQERKHGWEKLVPRKVELKNLGLVEIQEIINSHLHMPSQTADDRAKKSLEVIFKAGRYWPRVKYVPDKKE